MPDPRIVIAVESANAEKNLSAVERGMREINAEAEKNSVRSALDDVNSRLRAAAAELDRAEAAYKSMREGMAAGWSYTKEQIDSITGSLQKSQTNFRALKDEQSSLRGRMTELSAAGEGASAAMNSAASGTQNLASKTKIATLNLGKLNSRMMIARISSKLLGQSVGGASVAMVASTAALGLAVFAIKHYITEWKKGLRAAADLEKKNSESMAEVTDRLRDRHQEQNDAMSVLARYAEVENLSKSETVEYQNALAQLGGTFDQLGVKIDAATGKVEDFYNAQAKMGRKQIDEEEKQIRAQLKQLAVSRKRAEEIRESTWAWFGDISESERRTDEIDRERTALMNRLSVLKKLNPEEKARIAQLKAEEKTQKSAAAKTVRNNNKLMRENQSAQDIVRRALKRQSGEMFKFRATTQGGVEAGSMAALELQSRRLLNPASPGSGGPAVQTANGVQQMVVQGQAILQKLDAALTTMRANTAAAQKMANGISGARALW